MNLLIEQGEKKEKSHVPVFIIFTLRAVPNNFFKEFCSLKNMTNWNYFASFKVKFIPVLILSQLITWQPVLKLETH